MIVLDTDHLSLLERASNPEGTRLRQRLEPIPRSERATTIISFEEQMRGWLSYLAKSQALAQQINAYRRLGRHLDNFCRLQVLEFSELAAAEFQRLRQAKLRVGTMDLKIAAIVLAHQATLLSRNLGDFRKITGLNVEDWTQ